MRQYVYFAIFSQVTTANQVTQRIGLEPDETKIRGSERTEPIVVRVEHAWTVRCDDAGMRVDEQISRVLTRLLPYEQQIRALTADPAAGCGAMLEVVRDFAAPEPSGGSDEAAEPDLELGWHIDRETLAFLLTVGAELGSSPDTLSGRSVHGMEASLRLAGARARRR